MWCYNSLFCQILPHVPSPKCHRPNLIIFVYPLPLTALAQRLSFCVRDHLRQLLDFTYIRLQVVDSFVFRLSHSMLVCEIDVAAVCSFPPPYCVPGCEYPPFIHPTGAAPWDVSSCGPIRTSAVMNTCVCVFWWTHADIDVGSVFSSGIVGPHSSAAVESAREALLIYIPNSGMWVPAAPYSGRYMLLSVVLF